MIGGFLYEERAVIVEASMLAQLERGNPAEAARWARIFDSKLELSLFRWSSS